MIFERGHFTSKKAGENLIMESQVNALRFGGSSYNNQRTVFLSHKHSDLDEINGVIQMLKDHGAKVYIDSMDYRLPNRPSSVTAEHIKEAIKNSRKFILLATEAAIKSFWCNWELGIGDVHKYVRHIAVLPIKEKGTYDSNYIGNEYLQLYPRIDYEDGMQIYKTTKMRIPAGYYHSRPPNSEEIRIITPLKEWLNE